MSTRRYTFQYKEVISINRESFLNKVVRNPDLSKKDLKVLMHLLTHLDGTNYKALSKKQIASDLYMSKSDVSESLENLLDLDLIQEGESMAVDKGYRLTF